MDTGGAVWRYYYGSDIPKNRTGKTWPWGAPDMDDTVVILQALYENNENIDDYYPTTATDYFINYQLRDAFITHKIGVLPIQLQYNSFNTWISEENQSRLYKLEAYEVVLNANVLFFYSTQLTTQDLQNQIPEVFDYINYASDKMNENRQNAIFPAPWAGADVSKYYPSPFSFTYFVSRAYKDGGAPITGNPSIDINKIKEYILADDDHEGELDRQETDGREHRHICTDFADCCSAPLDQIHFESCFWKKCAFGIIFIFRNFSYCCILPKPTQIYQ